MSSTSEIINNTNINEKINVMCAICKNSTKHIILQDIQVKGECGDDHNGHYERYVQWHDDYQIIQCLGCENIVFRTISSNSEDVVQVSHDGQYKYVEVEKLYPNPEEGRTSVKDNHLLPQKLKSIYDETLTALNSGQSILVGIGIRAIIETVCKDQQALTGSLYNKIDVLASQGILTAEGAIILHQLRVLGNDAAHEVKPHTNIQLSLAFDVIDHLLQGVYILPYNTQNSFN